MNWQSVSYGNGVFIAVASTSTASPSLNKFMYSLNGAQWSAILATPNNSNWVEIAYGNGVWVVVAEATTGSGLITRFTASTTTSPILPAITPLAITPPTTVSQFRSVAYGNGYWIAVGVGATSSDPNFYRSSDSGQTWTGIAGTNFIAIIPQSVAYANGVWLIVCSYNPSGNTTTAFYSADDGATWNTITMPYNLFWTSVSYQNGQWMAVGYDAGGPPAVTTCVAISGKQFLNNYENKNELILQGGRTINAGLTVYCYPANNWYITLNGLPTTAPAGSNIVWREPVTNILKIT